MSPAEIGGRVRDEARRQAWRRRQVHPGRPANAGSSGGAGSWPVAPATVSRTPPRPLPAEARAEVPLEAAQALIAAADGLLGGTWDILGVPRLDMVAPDWFLDPITGRRAPRERYAFQINQRSEDETGNVKQVWELSRHHHLTVLAAAFYVTGDDRYAEAAGAQLRSWWHDNPFLSGVHWTSGIELGVRLMAWTWVRRLLDEWPGVTGLFEDNDAALCQLYWHQQYLAGFVSRGSSANNHVIAEAAGQLCASSAFAWWPESGRWRRRAAELLERELAANTFASGVNRELASEYHCFVAELGMIAALEADVAGHPLSAATEARLCAMVDAAAALVDERLVGPRQGDGDDGRALLLDPPGSGSQSGSQSDSPLLAPQPGTGPDPGPDPRPDSPDGGRWESMLALGAGRFGACGWWPATPTDDVRSVLLAALAGPAGGRHVAGRPMARRSHFPDAGITLLRSASGQRPEIWCRCDGGPLGYLSIAAHGHADALAVELRHGGVDVFADPGTYCYHGEAKWRAYFRSTVAHNTVELDGRDQSVSGGPFLWVRGASTRQLDVAVDTDDGVESWSAEHDGYQSLDPPAVHRRSVRLDRAAATLSITDRVECDGRHRCRMAFHMGPSVRAVLAAGVAALEWSGPHGSVAATVRLPTGLDWQLHRGEEDPPMGWFSRGFGRRQPALTLLGTGRAGSADGDFVTIVEFHPDRPHPDWPHPHRPHAL